MAIPTEQLSTCSEQRFAGSSNSQESGDKCSNLPEQNRTADKPRRELFKTKQGGGDGTPNGEILSGKVEENMAGELGAKGQPGVTGKLEGEPKETVDKTSKKRDQVRPLSLKTTTPLVPPVPPSSQCESAETDSSVVGMKKAPTEVMSPRSYSFFKSSLVHVPEMNLPWESMRKTSKCGCGVTFSYSTRKVSCYIRTCACTCIYENSAKVGD